MALISVKMGNAGDVSLPCALIDIYSKCGSTCDDAQCVFDLTHAKTTVGWTLP